MVSHPLSMREALGSIPSVSIRVPQAGHSHMCMDMEHEPDNSMLSKLVCASLFHIRCSGPFLTFFLGVIGCLAGGALHSARPR